MNLGTSGDPITLTKKNILDYIQEVGKVFDQHKDDMADYAFVWHPKEKCWWTAKMNPDGSATLIRLISDKVDSKFFKEDSKMPCKGKGKSKGKK